MNRVSFSVLAVCPVTGEILHLCRVPVRFSVLSCSFDFGAALVFDLDVTTHNVGIFCHGYV